MRILMKSVFLVASVVSMTAMAEEGVTPSSTAEQAQLTKGVFDQNFVVTPRLGILGYGDSNQNYTSRALAGFNLDYNLTNLMSMPTNWVLGLETAFLYTHTGSAGSNFFGTNSVTETIPGANSFMVPLTAALGYKPTDKTLVSLNLGPSLFYRSIGQSMYFGRAGDTSSGSAVDFFPDLGLSAGWAVSPNVGLSLRGDLIPTPGQDMFMATVGATFGIV